MVNILGLEGPRFGSGWVKNGVRNPIPEGQKTPKNGSFWDPLFGGLLWGHGQYGDMGDIMGMGNGDILMI